MVSGITLNFTIIVFIGYHRNAHDITDYILNHFKQTVQVNMAHARNTLNFTAQQLYKHIFKIVILVRLVLTTVATNQKF